MKIGPRFIIGVDEAGRAPLAGPVAVGVVAVPADFDVAREFAGVKDSKQLTELGREKIYKKLEERKKAGDVHFRVCFGSHEVIDERGITIAVKQAVRRGVIALAPADNVEKIYLDGLLYAPREYTQETVVHGDELVPIISLASIAAKVTRDHLMVKYSRAYPVYLFGKHKGYPTKLHYQMLAEHGPCAIHRKSYLPLH
jgi:ribonuclease HII